MRALGEGDSVSALPPVLLLDLDDTIVHFSQGRPDFWASCFEARRAAHHPDARTFAATIRKVAIPYWSDPQMAARGRMDLHRARREVAAQALEHLGVHDRALAHEVADAFTVAKEDAVAPFAGAVEALHALASRGVRLGLVTNGQESTTLIVLGTFKDSLTGNGTTKIGIELAEMT